VTGIYCCSCGKDVYARLTDGKEIYPHRVDLFKLPFWKCDDCGNYVGCHHKTSKPTQPLGCIPTKEIKEARIHIHELLDPIWKSGKISRAKLYKKISSEIGFNFHTANIRSIEEARVAYKIVKSIS